MAPKRPSTITELGTISISAHDQGLASDQMEVSITLRGTPANVIGALANGLPREALQAMHDALGEEMRRRQPARAVSRRRTKRVTD